MKKIIIVFAVFATFSVAASAQKRPGDSESKKKYDGGIELIKTEKVESNLRIAFPMYFGESLLLNNQDKNLETIFYKNFLYQLEMANLSFSSRKSHLGVSFGVRWTFMDFALNNTDITFRKNDAGVYAPYKILYENTKYDGKKSKIHASYIGIPIRLCYKAGRGKVYVGASAEYLVNGYTKYKNPGYREVHSDLFKRFRASAEAGFAYGLLGVFVNYGITPLFPSDWNDSHTLSFGLTLGI